MEKKKGISGSTLKMIAIVTMLIDHIGAAVLARLLMVNGLGELDQTNTDGQAAPQVRLAGLGLRGWLRRLLCAGHHLVYGCGSGKKYKQCCGRKPV